MLENYIEFDRKVQKVPGKGKTYLAKLKREITRDGLKYPITLAVNKNNGKAYIYEGNHRLTIFKDKNVEWVPVKVNYLFYHQDDDPRFRYIPGTIWNFQDWPKNPTPADMGFKVRKLLLESF